MPPYTAANNSSESGSAPPRCGHSTQCSCHSTLAAGESAASVSDICIETFLRLGDELVSIGYLSCIGNFLIRSIGLAESDVVLEACIEEDSLLVYIAYQLAEIIYGQVFHVDAIDEHLAFLHVIVTWNQIHHRTLTATALTYECHGLALRNHEVDVFQHVYQFVALIVCIGE